MGYKTELQSNNADLQTILNKVNALPEAGGGGGGSSFETSEVTVVQNWGMNDDPILLRVGVFYHNILADGSIETGYVTLKSDIDFEPQHSVTFTVLKNTSIGIGVYCFSGHYEKITITTQNGTMQKSDESNLLGDTYIGFIPTGDTATITFSSP